MADPADAVQHRLAAQLRGWIEDQGTDQVVVAGQGEVGGLAEHHRHGDPQRCPGRIRARRGLEREQHGPPPGGRVPHGDVEVAGHVAEPVAARIGLRRGRDQDGLPRPAEGAVHRPFGQPPDDGCGRGLAQPDERPGDGFDHGVLPPEIVLRQDRRRNAAL
ncbi:hypothetical protein AB0F15_04440 [Amycolatopsis sp. NPDC026612]|uniref:hypothetical protein n=1 Tax=Amycolatopsis sp. NPDC026612 TaxID=3155466 RepID=UPI0033F01DF8